MSMKKKIRAALYAIALLIMLFNGISLRFGQTNTPKAPAGDGIHFIDVGQGDATLLLSGGQAVLIDGGDASHGQTIIDYLHAQGIQKLYAVVATHPHADHIGGLSAVLNAFPTEKVYMGGETTNTRTFEKLLDAIEAQGITPAVPKPQEVLSFASGASLTFVAPTDSLAETDLNNRSLVCRFEGGGTSVLLMGDAEVPSELALLDSGAAVQSDILKVGHHGSETSSSPALLAAVNPKTAVIFCAEGNDYGHPHKVTLDALAAQGVSDVRITAKTGSIVIPL